MTAHSEPWNLGLAIKFGNRSFRSEIQGSSAVTIHQDNVVLLSLTCKRGFDNPRPSHSARLALRTKPSDLSEPSGPVRDWLREPRLPPGATGSPSANSE